MSNSTINIEYKNRQEIYIILSGIIDTSFADTLNEVIEKAHLEFSNAKIILDFTKVSIITNSCVEYLLKYINEGVKLQLVGVNKEVSVVLKLTGIDSKLEMENEVKSIDVSNCKLLGKGFHSEVYKLDDETIAKIYYDLPSIDTLISERIMAKQAFVKGVPTEISFGLCESNGKAGLMYELVDADTLLSVFVKDPNNIEKYIPEYVSLVKRIHEFDSIGMLEIPDMKQILINNVNNLKKYINDDAEKLMKVVNSIPNSNHLLHGDPHPANVMLTNNGMIFIDLSDMRTGNEILDLVYLNRTLVQFQKIPTNNYALSRQDSKRLWDLFAEEYFKELSDIEKEQIKAKIDLLALLNITERFIRKNPNDETAITLLKELIDKTRNY